jgi:DNA-binding response OmpR family regulator
MEESTKKILIVEDEASQRKALVDKFTHEGFRVVEAKDGKDGLNVARKELPDVILLDIIMPKMDGMTMLKILREDNAWGKKVPVIMLTNQSADDRVNNEILENEPAYYLVKANWSLNDVVEKVKECLSRPV